MKKKLAFTLVELLIVVIILGILAAVVIPQFSDASQDARYSSLQTNLATMRGQIELYRLQHNGQLPTVANFVTQMTTKTDANGNAGAGAKYGPYMQAIPQNPFTATNDVSAAAGAAGANKAWLFNATTGDFRANDGGTAPDGTLHSAY